MIGTELGAAALPPQEYVTCVMRLGRQGGRACEVCAQVLEKRVQNLPGVKRVTASCRGGGLTVSYDQAVTSEERIFRQIQQMGAPVGPSCVAWEPAPPAEPVAPGLWPQITGWVEKRRQTLEVIFTAVTFVAMIAGWLTERAGLPAISLIAYITAYAAGGVFSVQAGLESLRHRTIDVDLLMVLAAIGAAIVGAPFEGALLLFLFSLSNVLQSYTLDRTRNAIRSLMKLRPDRALVRRGDETIMTPIEEIQVDDLVVVRPGERLPLDGQVVEGESSVDQASLTGESMPVSKGVGDMVFAGTINGQGGLEIRVTKLAGDSTIARLIKLVEQAQSDKAETQRFIDTAEQYYAMGVIGMTILAAIIPLLFLAEPFETAFYRAMTLMVAASPCALVISTPATVLSAIANGARKGVLFKGGVYVEQAAAIKVIAFDKTGTLTQGKPAVTDLLPLNGSVPEEMLALAAAVESRSEHPLGEAIVAEAEQRQIAWEKATAFQSQTGKGVSGQVNGQTIAAGNARFFESFQLVNGEEMERAVAQLQAEGKTAIVVAMVDETQEKARPIGAIGVADILRPNIPEVVRKLKKAGIEKVVMLTGDNEQVAQAIGRQAGVDAVYANLLPEDKLTLLRELEEEVGPVAMVGDGVNDAPALAAASIGIAMGAAGADVALETADVVLMADDLGKIPYVIALSRRTRRTLTQNLVFAIAVIVALVGGVLGFNLALPLSVVGHEGSTVLVSLNGLRLLAFKSD